MAKPKTYRCKKVSCFRNKARHNPNTKIGKEHLKYKSWTEKHLSSAPQIQTAIIETLQFYGKDSITVRGLFYQLCSPRHLDYVTLDDTANEYSRMNQILTNMRLGRAGLPQETIDHINSCIVDSSRFVGEWYKPRIWKGQKSERIWVICEKDTMRAFFSPICRKYGLPFIASRGFMPVTLRLRLRKEKADLIIYAGDFDPSGCSIDSTLQKELQIPLKRIAITPELIDKYNLPMLPLKPSDPRYKKFKKKYGEQASQIDALESAILKKLVKKAILAEITDPTLMSEFLIEEKEENKAEYLVNEALKNIREKLMVMAIAQVKETNKTDPEDVADKVKKGQGFNIEVDEDLIAKLLQEELKEVVHKPKES